MTIETLAVFASCTLLYLQDAGVPVKYFELSTRPDGQRHTYIAPQDYAMLSRAVQSALRATMQRNVGAQWERRDPRRCVLVRTKHTSRAWSCRSLRKPYCCSQPILHSSAGWATLSTCCRCRGSQLRFFTAAVCRPCVSALCTNPVCEQPTVSSGPCAQRAMAQRSGRL